MSNVMLGAGKCTRGTVGRCVPSLFRPNLAGDRLIGRGGDQGDSLRLLHNKLLCFLFCGKGERQWPIPSATN